MTRAFAFDSAKAAPLVELIYIDAGGGHRSSASALQAVFEEQRRPWRVRMTNLRDVLDSIDLIRRLARVRVEDVYNLLLKTGLTVGSGAMLKATQLLIRRMHAQEVTQLARFWSAEPPDLVVSLVPNFNRAIFESLRAFDNATGRRFTPMVTILTDLADYPPHFWIERQEQYLICGTSAAVAQALAMGHPPARIFRTSGMIVRPEFYRSLRACREQERTRLGLRADLPTGLVMFGGYGSRRMLTIAERVAETGLKTQLIFMCGKNEALRERLAAMKLPFPFHAEGFTRDVPHYMHLSDYFIGKPGPGSVSEALVMGLPVIVERNSWTMVQERYNTKWITQNELGVVLHSFAEIAIGLAPMVDSERLARFRSRIRALRNRAVFEIPEILAGLLALHARRGHHLDGSAVRGPNHAQEHSEPPPLS
jgi:Glycosyltransferase family 28 C-terminal domain